MFKLTIKLMAVLFAINFRIVSVVSNDYQSNVNLFATVAAANATRNTSQSLRLLPENRAKLMFNNGSKVDRVAWILKKEYRQKSKLILKTLIEAGFPAETSLKAVKTLFRSFSLEFAVSVFKTVRVGCSNSARYVINVFKNVSRDRLLKSLKDVGYNTNDLAFTLKDVWNINSFVATKILKKLQFPVISIANSMRSVYLKSKQETISLLHRAGYLASDLISTAHGFGETNIQTIVGWMKSAGYRLNDITRALKNNFRLSAKSTLRILLNLGYRLNSIKTAVSQIFRLSLSNVARLISSL